MLIQVRSNQQLIDEENAQAQEFRDAQEQQNKPILTSLAAYVRDCWQASKEAKLEVENRMIEAVRQKKGEYSPSKLAAIHSEKGSEIFMMLTDEKCAAATAWITDILFPADDKPWGIKPTPVPELSPEHTVEIKQRLAQSTQLELSQELNMQIQGGAITSREQAQQWLLQAMQVRAGEIAEELRHEMSQASKEANSKIETKLEDIIDEAEWGSAVRECIDDIVTFPAGVLKGPVLRRRKKLKWKEQQQGPPIEVKEEISLEFNRVSPFDIYPLPNSKKPSDGLIERHSLTRNDLQAMIDVEGYNKEAINLVLQEYGRYGAVSWLNVGQDYTRQALEDRPREDRSPETRIDALQFWGSCQGLMLLEYGIDPERIQDPLAEYQVEVWLVDRYVIKAEINGDPLGRVPYHFASFRNRNGSIWGAGVPELIKDSQDACNASARNLINNMAIASGPQVTYDVSQLPAGTQMPELRPWQKWPIDGKNSIAGSQGRPPVSFFAPPSMAADLMRVYEFFSDQADTKTGIPKYSYGSRQGGSGALSTASGFSMMMNNATRGIKNVVRNIDKGITKPSIEMTHQWALLYSNDPEYYSGDIKIIARGSNALIAKEQTAVRRNEFLQVAVNPAVLQVIGMNGLAEVLRGIVAGMDFPSDDIVPSKQEMQRKQEVATQQAQQAQKGVATDGAGAVQGGRDAKVV